MTYLVKLMTRKIFQSTCRIIMYQYVKGDLLIQNM